MIIGDTVPIQLDWIILNKGEKVSGLQNEDEFPLRSRFRCEQVNTSRFNGNLVHYVQQQFQYYVKQDLSNSLVHVKLEDYNKEITPKFLEESFDFIEATEKIKNNVLLKLDKKSGKPIEILNTREIYDNWQEFKNNEFSQMPFIKKIGETNSKVVEELLQMGDIQFGTTSKNQEEYWRNFFYFVCFDQYLFNNDNWENVNFDFVSTIVPPITIPLIIRYDKVNEKDGICTIRKIATYDLSDFIVNEIKERYDTLHKDVVKYNFTSYRLTFRATLELDINKKVVNNARVVLKEEILDNIENECIYTFKKLENFIP